MTGPFGSIRGLGAIAALALASALTASIASPVEAAPEGQISFARLSAATSWFSAQSSSMWYRSQPFASSSVSLS